MTEEKISMEIVDAIKYLAHDDSREAVYQDDNSSTEIVMKFNKENDMMNVYVQFGLDDEDPENTAGYLMSKLIGRLANYVIADEIKALEGK